MAKPNGIKDVSGWASDREALHARIAPRFRRPEPRRWALAYLCWLLSPAERKNGWQPAGVVGERTSDGMQWLLGAAGWDAESVRDDLRS